MKTCVVGSLGNVGQALCALLRDCAQVDVGTPSPADAIRGAITFLCLPADTIGPGDIDDSLVRAYVENPNLFPVAWVVCSTVLPGILGQLRVTAPVYHMPIFANESTMAEDIKAAKVVAIGTSRPGEMVEHDVLKAIRRLSPHALMQTMTWEETALAKYAANAFYAVKVAYWNEVYRACQRFGAHYQKVRDLATTSRGWVHPQHTTVPGKDGLGFAGHCLPKDALAFSVFSKMAETALEVNATVRGEKC